MVFILFEIFAGQADRVAAGGDQVNKHVKASLPDHALHRDSRLVHLPSRALLGGYLLGGVDDSAMNLVASLADFVYEIAFCLAIWAAAKLRA